MHPSPVGDSARFSDGSFSESEDIYMTINNDHDPEFFGVEPPRAALLTKEPSQNERQISVDPISIQGSIRQASFRLVSAPMITPKKGSGSNPSIPPSKLKFVSSSLPSSTSSSPQSTSLLKKIWKNQSDHNKPSSRKNLARIQSAMDDTHLAMAETTQRRSKSLGEGRRSSHVDDFDLWLEKTGTSSAKATRNTVQSRNIRNFSKPPLGPSGEDRLNTMKKSSRRDQNYPEKEFNCGKFCLYLPRGKGKPVRSISTASTLSSYQTDPPTISRTVSLERFECNSFTSSLNEDESGDSANLFFDLPMELLRCSVSDMQSPVTAAFVFDNDNNNNNDIDIDSVTREDFNVFIEAQS